METGPLKNLSRGQRHNQTLRGGSAGPQADCLRPSACLHPDTPALPVPFTTPSQVPSIPQFSAQILAPQRPLPRPPPSSKLSLLSLTADQAPFRQKTFHNLYRDITWCLIWWDQKLHESRQWNQPCHGYKHSAQQSAWHITGTQTSGPNRMNTGLSSRSPKIPQSWKGGWESRWGKEVLWSQRSICLTMNRWNHA